jgi:hypothetical protein
MTKPKKEEYIQIGRRIKLYKFEKKRRNFLERWLNLKKEKMNSM